MERKHSILLVALFVVCALIGLYAISTFSPLSSVLSTLTKMIKPAEEASSISEQLSTLANHEISFLKYIGNILIYFFKYVFGIDLTGGDKISDSKIIILIAIWGIFFLVFKDMAKLFGMMSETTSFLIAFFIATIISNLGFFRGFLTILMEAFAIFAGVSIIAVLVSIVFFALVSHWGISELGMWMMKRQAMLKAAEMEAGGKELAGTITALGEAGKALSEMK